MKDEITYLIVNIAFLLDFADRSDDDNLTIVSQASKKFSIDLTTKHSSRRNNMLGELLKKISRLVVHDAKFRACNMILALIE